MSTSPWPRDPKLPFPLTYAHFQGKKPMKKLGGRIPYITITDLPEDRFEDAIDHMVKFFAAEEPITNYLRMNKDIQSMEVIRKDWRSWIQQRCTLVAFADVLDDNGKPQIAGINVLYVKTKSESIIKEEETLEEPYCTIIDCLETVKNKCDIFEKFNVDKYLYAMGLSVNSDYYGQGIGKQLLLAREPLCRRALNCPITATVFTALNSQGLAKATGFEEVAELEYATYCNPKGIYVFKDFHKENPVKSCKLMVKIF